MGGPEEEGKEDWSLGEHVASLLGILGTSKVGRSGQT